MYFRLILLTQLYFGCFKKNKFKKQNPSAIWEPFKFSEGKKIIQKQEIKKEDICLQTETNF